MTDGGLLNFRVIRTYAVSNCTIVYQRMLKKILSIVAEL